VVKEIIAALKAVAFQSAFVTVEVKFVVAENVKAGDLEITILFDQLFSHGDLMAEIPHMDQKFSAIPFGPFLDGCQPLGGIRFEPDGMMVQIRKSSKTYLAHWSIPYFILIPRKRHFPHTPPGHLKRNRIQQG
jgi:hypothetical protein